MVFVFFKLLYRLFLCKNAAFLWLSSLFLYFFTSSHEIYGNFFDDAKNTGRTSRQKYEENLYLFQNLETGKALLKSLSYLEAIKDKIKEPIVEEKEMIADEKNLHIKEIQQYNKYKIKHPNIISIVPLIQKAVKEVFGDIILKLKEKRIKRKLSNIMKKIKTKILLGFTKKEKKRSFLQQNKIKENKEINKDEKITEDAITLNNILKILSYLKRELSEHEYNKLFEDQKLLARKLIRPDITMDKNEFKKLYLGFKNEKTTRKISKRVINELKKNFFSSSFSLLHTADTIYKIGGVQSNECLDRNKICDRRIYSDSCESRFEIEDQALCSVCWIIATLQGLELLHCMHSGKDTNYSIQEILDCSIGAECDSSGTLIKVLDTLIKRKRLSDAKSYPYEREKMQCKDNKPNVWTGKYEKTFSSYGKLCRSEIKFNLDQWIDFLKDFIARQGSIFAYIKVEDDFKYTQGGVIYTCSVPSGGSDHSFLITGWTVKKGVPVWIVRNTWGYWWGDNGYGFVAISNLKCKSGFEPFSDFMYLPQIYWSDKINEYKIIKTDTKQEKDIFIKTQKILRGRDSMLYCAEREIIRIEQDFVINYSKISSETSLCSELKIEENCNDRPACHIFFPHNMCQSGFDVLLIHYECVTRIDYDCFFAKSKLVGITKEMCIDFCNKAAKNCRYLTKKCLDKHIDPTLCDLEDVITDTDQT